MLANIALTMKFVMIAVIVSVIASVVGMVQNISSTTVFPTDSTGTSTPSITWQGTAP